MGASSSVLLSGHAVDVAPQLLGAILASNVDGVRVSLRVTEVEAYGGVGNDPGSHAFRRRTPRNETMFGPAGRAYVYFTYGMHWCVNIVTGPADTAGAVLLRAGEIIEGIDLARSRRPSARVDRDLARGPARLTAALGITGDVDGTSVLASNAVVKLRLPTTAPTNYMTSPRTGVGGDGAPMPWRFYLPGEPSVSPYRAAAVRARRD